MKKPKTTTENTNPSRKPWWTLNDDERSIERARRADVIRRGLRTIADRRETCTVIAIAALLGGDPEFAVEILKIPGSM